MVSIVLLSDITKVNANWSGLSGHEVYLYITHIAPNMTISTHFGIKLNTTFTVCKKQKQKRPELVNLHFSPLKVSIRIS